MTTKTTKSVNLTQKRMICHCLTKYWLKFDDLYPGDLMRREIEQKNKMMAEISELRNRINYLPPVKYQRRYQLDLSKRDRQITKAALLHTYRKLNHEADKYSVSNKEMKELEKDITKIETIYHILEF